MRGLVRAAVQATAKGARNTNTFAATTVQTLGVVRHYTDQRKHFESALLINNAAATGNLEQLSKLVSQQGLDVNINDYDKRTPLHLAASEGHKDVVEYLLKHGANVNVVDRWGGTPLQDAIRAKHDEVANVLRQNGGVSLLNQEDAASALCKAAFSADTEQIKRLLFSGVDVNLGDYDNRTALHLAAAAGHEDVVRLLIKNGADVNATDRYGSSPLNDALSRNHHKIVKILQNSGAIMNEDINRLRQMAEFSSSLQRSLPLLCERGNWAYAEAWIPNNENAVLLPSTAWYAASEHVNEVTAFRQSNELTKYEYGHGILGRVWETRMPEWKEHINTKDITNAQMATDAGIRAGLAVPVIYNDQVLAVLVFYSFEARAVNQDLIDDFFSFSSRLIVKGLPTKTMYTRRAKPLTASGAGVFQEQMNAVYNLIVEEGIFNSSLIYQEVDWFYNNLGLDKYYFEHYSPVEIAKHIHSFIAAKKVAQTTGNAEDISFSMESENSAFYICPAKHEIQIKLERHIEEFMEKRSTTSLRYFRSKGTILPSGNMHLALYIVQSTSFIDPRVSERETDIWKVSTGVFLRDKPTEARDRYANILKKAVGRLTPVMEVTYPASDGSIRVMIAFKQGSAPTFLSAISELLNYNNMICERKFVERFANKMVVYSFYIRGSRVSDVKKLVDQASLIYVLPHNSLTSMFYERKLTAQQYVYSYSAWKFVYYFLSQQSDEYLSLAQTLKGDKANMSRLERLRNRLRRDALSEARIAECIHRYPALVQELYEDFANFFSPSSAVTPFFNKELQSKIKKTVSNQLDEQILTGILTFNEACLKTNFFASEKASISFRLNPRIFLDARDFTEIPYGLFFVIGSEFRGFHVRFRDVARGGIRIVKSANLQTYNRNLETLFAESYNLALTQQKKNKDIPEGGSKGALLLRLERQDHAEMAFKKYIEGLLDLLLKNPEIVDHYGQEELLFLGPDEHTADYMDWASLHARERGYPFWKSFTTGKSPEFGGIPHDTFGMTTRSVHAYVVETLKKKGLEESTVTKFQTGGPDGDLGSNEIKISKDKTIAIVDGSGVCYDPNGIDRSELLRLANERKMIKHINKNALSPAGFLIQIEDRDVTLPNGEYIESGLSFRNNFHLHPLSSADLFVPCGGRPESVNITNVNKLFHEDGTPRFKFIIEGANLFLTNEARATLEKAGVILYKDASTNKGGVTSSSLEVLAALALNDEEFKSQMQVKDPDNPPAFYQHYVEELQRTIHNNANLEFHAIWNQNEKSGVERSVLTDVLSEKINRLNDAIQESALWNNTALRNAVLQEALPNLLINTVGLDTLLNRIPENYFRAIFGSYLASRYIYKFGIKANEFAFFEFMQRYVAKANGISETIDA